MTSKHVFEKFVPEQAVSYCDKLYQKLGFEFKIKKARKTKFGDFRYDPRSTKYTITINNDLNAFAFLVTYLHEVAHLIAFKQYGRKINPHGTEWKQTFSQISQPVLNESTFPKEVLQSLINYFRNPKASSCSDPDLYMILKRYDGRDDTVLLKEIPIGSTFKFKGTDYQKLEIKRTRSVCLQIQTERKYLIPEIAEVTALG